MPYGAILFSLMFFIASLTYLYWGSSIIRIDPKDKLNRAFLGLSLTLCLWTFGYAVGNLAQSPEVALFWRRLASMGRMALFAAILYFILLLTHPKDVLTKKGPLLAIPALVLVYVYSLSYKMAPLQYNLMQIDWGWVDKPVANIWTSVYHLYMLSYMLLSLALVLRWKKKIKDQAVSKKANLIVATIVVAILFGLLLDILPSLVLKKPLPQLASIVILIPVWAMYHAAKYDGVFKADIISKTEDILTTDERQNVLANLSIAFYLAGVLTFISEYIPYMDQEDALKLALVKTLTIITVGIMIRIIQIIKNESLKENLTIIVLAASIPIILLQFLKYTSVTVWAFSLIFVSSAIVFSRPTLLILTTLTAIFTQIVIWLLRPEASVIVDKYDYILRIGMLIVAFFIGLYSNRIYVSKIKENTEQLKFEKMVSDNLFDFATLKQANLQEKTNNLLERVGLFFDADRTYLFTIDHQEATMAYSYEWCQAGIRPEIKTIDPVPLDAFSWWIDQLAKNKVVYIKDIEDLPKVAKKEKAKLEKQGVQSLISLPIFVEGTMQAFMGIHSVTRPKNWGADKIKQLDIISSILVSGLTQIESDKEVEFLAYYDQLTRLPNRFLFANRLNQAIQLAKERGQGIAVVFIDLDNFKSVNDTIGHQGGDRLLQEIAQALLTLFPKTDALARFAGDEFAIMLDQIDDPLTITKTADGLMTLFTKAFTVNGQEFLVTASGGIAIYPTDGKDADSLIKNADMAMYQAKDKGKNQYALCNQQMKDAVQRNMELSNDLYRALEQDELHIYYQPQINLKTKKISGVEALLRWVHPTKGMISPGIFIPIAEKNSLINSIGEWVLKKACEQNKKWQEMGLPPITMAINLSAIQIINPKIAENIEGIIKESGLDPQYLELEITESVAIKERDYVLTLLNKLKKIGLAIAIDDFGTEYSSLGRLKDLPIDRIKIDLQFVQGIESSEKNKAITVVIINLAKSLGLSVVAEGVETKVQLEFLEEKLCDDVQGYYYYKPMPAHAMEKILETKCL